ncbi:MAG: KH domain-containing protein [Eubacterium sp.]|nr:KH domain-containing protein [Eubacterium sp.]
MKELLIAMVQELVDDKSAIEVTVDEPNEEGTTVYHLHVAPDDMGRVIGKQGRIAKAIRTIMRAGAVRYNQKVMVEID